VWLQPQQMIFNTPGAQHQLPSVAMATSENNTPGPEDSTFSVPIIARLIVHTTKQANKKKTTKKDTKTKEFTHTFSATKSNYLEFLSTILTKHHIGNKLQVTDRRRYTCKMQVPPSMYVFFSDCFPTKTDNLIQAREMRAMLRTSQNMRTL
jgi:hypothetical protein